MRIPKPCLVCLSIPQEKVTLALSIAISPTLVIDTSMERSLRVATTAWKPKNLNYFSKKFKIEF